MGRKKEDARKVDKKDEKQKKEDFLCSIKEESKFISAVNLLHSVLARHGSTGTTTYLVFRDVHPHVESLK